MKRSSSRSSELVKEYWPFVVAALMVGYVVALALVLKTDIDYTTAFLRQM